jgi:hypothetical protein
VDFPVFARMRGATGRFRRELRRRMLEPILVGNRSMRETVLNALATRGHLIYCLGDYLGRVPLVIEYAPKRYAAEEAARLRELLQQHYKTFHRLGPETKQAEPISALASITGFTDILVL